MAEDSQPTKTNDSWSIVIHGGADGRVEKMSEEAVESRRQGMKKALDHGIAQLKKGSSAIEVVESVIKILEDDPVFNAGKGAVRTSEGKFELDASIMDGTTLRCGGVAGIANAAHPISVARAVMNDTPHVLLTADGAEAFAEKIGLADAEETDFELPKGADENDGAMAVPSGEIPHYGTVGCVVRDGKGHIAAGTSTGGLSGKMPGRTGDSPIIGAGTYADDRYGGCSGTGKGEEYIRTAAAYDLIAQMRYAGKDLSASVKTLMEDTLPPKTGGIIAIDAEGNIALGHNTPSMIAGSADAGGRYEIEFIHN